MPDSHKLRLHIEYDVLYVADLRTIVRTFENAYNILQKTEQQRRRVRRADRLTVQTVRTGNSLTLTALGGIGLAKLGILIATRELLWKSEKTKWEAKNAKLDYEERIRQVEAAKIEQIEAALDRENASEVKAAKLLEKLTKFVAKSKVITSLDVEIDGQDDEPRAPRTLLTPTGRKFR
jgi:hypothetical protein